MPATPMSRLQKSEGTSHRDRISYGLVDVVPYLRDMGLLFQESPLVVVGVVVGFNQTIACGFQSYMFTPYTNIGEA